MKRLVTILLIVGFSVFGTLSTATACVHGMMEETDDDTKLLTRARVELDWGNNRQAIRILASQYGHLRNKGADDIEKMSYDEREALTALAVGTVRSKGAFAVTKVASKVKTAKARKKNVRWAYEMLEAQLQNYPNSAERQMHVAEAMATVPKQRRRAYEMLKKLSDNSLMTDAHGYILLAHLAESFGDTAAAKSAMKGCKTMSVDAATICKAKPSS